jgi:broad specificity phosphatase PhoE
MEIHLIRHGNMAGDPHAHLLPPVTGCLSERGAAQAAALGGALKDIPFTHVYSSPLGRALQTAQAVTEGRGLEIGVETWLEEWKPAHIMEGRDDTRYEAMMEDASKLRPEQTWKTAAGESLLQMADRIIPGMQSLLARHGVEAGHGGWLFQNPENQDRIALVAHGGSLNVLMNALLGLPLKPGSSFQFQETGIAVVGFHRVLDVWYTHLKFNPPKIPGDKNENKI